LLLYPMQPTTPPPAAPAAFRTTSALCCNLLQCRERLLPLSR
jgi:hypothetical protein